MIYSRFDFDKTLQMAGRFIHNFSGRLNYTKLLKLMYLADRSSLGACERTISGDKFFSLPKGPILSSVYELIKGELLEGEKQQAWNEHISKQRYDLLLIKDPGLDELSDYEVELIDKLSEQFMQFNLGEMIQFCHDNLPEWEDPGASCVLIKEEAILSALGKSEGEIEAIREEIESIESLKEAPGEY